MRGHNIISLIFATCILSSSCSHRISKSNLQSGTSPADTASANILFANADTLKKTAKYDSSNVYYEKASLIYKQAKDFEKFITCYNNIGENLNQKRDSQRAIEYLTEAVDICLNQFGPKHPAIAQSYKCLGDAYNNAGDTEKAFDFHNKSLSIRLELFGENHPDVASSYIGIGNDYLDKGEYDKSLESYKAALSIALATVGEYDFRTAVSYLSLATAYFYQNDVDLAIEYLQQSLRISLKVLGNKHPMVAGTYNNLGAIYLFKEDYDNAIKYLTESASVAINIFGENHPDVARSYENIASIYRSKSDYSEANKLYEKSLAIQIATLGETNPEVARCYTNIGVNYHKMGNGDKAIENYEKALSIQHNLLGEVHPSVGLTYSNIGAAYELKGDYGLALNYYQKSIIALVPGFNDSSVYSNPPLDNVLSVDFLLNTLKNKALDFEKLYSGRTHKLEDLQASLTTYGFASQLIYKMMSGLKAEDSKLFLGIESAKIHGRAIGTAIQLFNITNKSEYKEIAHSFAQKGKAGLLQEALKESQAKIFSGIPDSLLQKEKQLRLDLVSCSSQIQDEFQKKDGIDSVKIFRLKDQTFSLSRLHDDLIGVFEKNYPKYYDLKYKTQPTPIADIQKALDAFTAEIDYVVGDSSIYIFVISNNRFEISSVPIDSSKFKHLVDGFCRSIKTFDVREFVTSGAELYRKLIRPIAHQLSGKRRLMIIPDGNLCYVPFEALLTNMPMEAEWSHFAKLNYLINRFEISYRYSTNSVVENAKESLSRKLSDSFVGFAPVFSDSAKNGYILSANRDIHDTTEVDWDDRSVVISGNRFRELRYSEEEVGSIISLFEQKVKVATGYFHKDASEEQFKATIEKYKYVHVATHGFINEVEPGLSGIVFSQPLDSNSTDDGVLYSGETYALSLNADLVVLSSCESGVGKLITGEGLMALTRGFLYAGTENIIVSLWKVSDKHTSQLMVKLYEGILAGKSYSQALREAKLKMITNEATAFPKSWSSFVLIGA